MVQSREINLASLLRFEPEKGRIWLKDYRMVMLSAAALGCLRKELISTIGWDQTRALLKRFGHSAGLADGRALKQRFPGSSPDQHMSYGPALHSLEGVARIVRDESRSRIDLDQGVYHVEAYWENSYEAEQHLDLLGESDVPVCWTLVGYATGHSSSAAGKDTVVVETRCKAMGHDRCRFLIGFADQLAEEALSENPDYEPQHLPEVLEELLGTVKQQKRTLQNKDQAISRLESELEETRRRRLLLGSSPALNKALDMARLLAPVNTTVLIRGESGTGKELMARFLHESSPRGTGPFVAVNCSALPDDLQEAELFGFKKGAFTGAVDDSQGLFEAAHGGTLFLDEIGDLALSAQTKILRALQEGEVKRLGETDVRKVDVRIVAATHRDLEAMFAERTFREDLYYRLSVVTLELPPLRDRGDDALLLAKHFAGVYAGEFSKKIRDLSRAAKCAIAAYPWPGNVRELQNAVQRGVILAQGDQVELEDLPDTVQTGDRAAVPAQRVAAASLPPSDEALALHEIADDAERIRRALDLADGNRERAAAMLGMSRTTLWRKLRSLDSTP